MSGGAGAMAIGIVAATVVAQAVDLDRAWPAAGELSSVAILAWYAWHNTTRVMPRLLREQRQENGEAREQFREELARQREVFAEALADERRQHLVELEMWHDQLATCMERWRP